MRPIWTGAISFGLVNVPIKLITATKKKNVKFRNLHEECRTPIKMKRYCPRCDREVEYEELVKGYEYEDNKFVILRDEDFDNLPAKATKTIDIVDFVNLEEIDPIYYLKTYYLQPAEGGEKPYVLLKRCLEESKKVAISRITIRTRESLAVVRVLNDVLALETMFFADEVRSAENLQIESLEDQVSIDSKEKELALQIVDNLTAEFEPEKYDNEYREQLMDIIRQKMEGEDIAAPVSPREEERVIDLMEKLRASIEATEEQAREEKAQKADAKN